MPACQSPQATVPDADVYSAASSTNCDNLQKISNAAVIKYPTSHHSSNSSLHYYDVKYLYVRKLVYAVLRNDVIDFTAWLTV